jgi:hypothetical protein
MTTTQAAAMVNVRGATKRLMGRTFRWKLLSESAHVSSRPEP